MQKIMIAYDAVIRAMETGEMYSSMGPLFREVSMEGNNIHIECTDVVQTTVFTGSKTPFCTVWKKCLLYRTG